MVKCRRSMRLKNLSIDIKQNLISSRLRTNKKISTSTKVRKNIIKIKQLTSNLIPKKSNSKLEKPKETNYVELKKNAKDNCTMDLIIYSLQDLYLNKTQQKQNDWKCSFPISVQDIKNNEICYLNSVSQSQQLIDLQKLNEYWKNSTYEYVVNNKLLDNFKKAQSKLGSDFSWIIGYHGTHESNFQSICENGFYLPHNPQYQCVNGQMYGAGAYFASYPYYAVQRGLNKDYNYTKILLCILLVGKSYGSKQNHNIASGDKLKLGYDSHCNQSKSLYVIFHPERILPLMLITGKINDINDIS